MKTSESGSREANDRDYRSYVVSLEIGRSEVYRACWCLCVHKLDQESGIVDENEKRSVSAKVGSPRQAQIPE